MSYQTIQPVDLSAPLARTETRAAEAFHTQLKDARSVAVAFSGGVDSSVTTALAARWLGTEAVVAVLGVSPSLAGQERTQAHTTADAMGVRLVEVMTYEMDDPDYVANRGNRCYFCKHELYSRAFTAALGGTGSDLLLNGDTADDQAGNDRPGMRAAAELGVRSPLATAGIGKDMVRALARALRLPVWDKPSAPCLASRVPVNTPVTIGGLARIEQAEAGLRDLGLRELRVRHLGHQARVELGAADLAAVAARGIEDRVVEVVQGAGYDDVELRDSPLLRS